MIFDLDHWAEIYESLRRNKLRTALTAFGVFWGILMLVLMLGSGEGLSNGIAKRFTGSATNSFFVWTRRTTEPYRGLPPGRTFELNNGDVEALQEQVPELRVVAPRLQLGGFRSGVNVTRGHRGGGFSVTGDVPENQEVQAVRMVQGRFLNPLDLQQNRKVTVIGQRVREVLFEEGEDPLGDSVEIRGVYFKVVGVFQSLLENSGAEEDDQRLIVPFTTFQRAFNRADTVDWLACVSADGVLASEAEEKAKAVLASRHQVAPTDTRAFGSFNLEEEYRKIQGLFGGIRLLVWIVGIGTLSAGVIGVSNILLIIVKERTKEIGLRRAVGATPWQITAQVILEAVVLTASAGYFGLVLGVGLLELVSQVLSAAGSPQAFSDPGVDLRSALWALVILVVSGVLAGLIPAQRAVRLKPVEALRQD